MASSSVVKVSTVTTGEEAIATANDTEYGLAGAVFTTDAGTAERRDDRRQDDGDDDLDVPSFMR